MAMTITITITIYITMITISITITSFNIIKNEDKPYTLYKLNDIGRQFTYTNLNVMKSRYLKDEIVILKYIVINFIHFFIIKNFSFNN